MFLFSKISQLSQWQFDIFCIAKNSHLFRGRIPKMVSPISNPETVCAAISESAQVLTDSQLLLSQTIQNFCSEVTSLSSLFGIGCGQIIAPFFRLRSAQFFGQLLGQSSQARFVSHYASLAVSLGVEGTGMHLGTQLIRTGKIEEGAFAGSLNSTLTIIACKAVGKIVPPNLIMLHLAQDAAMVGLGEITCQVGLSEKTTGSWTEKLLHAEVTSIQMECSATFVKFATPQVALLHAKCELGYQMAAGEKSSLSYRKQITTLRENLASFQYANKTDLLIASSLMLAGCSGEQGGFIGGMFYLFGKGVKRILARTPPQLNEPQKQSPKTVDKSKIFGPAIYELADFLNTREVRNEQLDPYLVATHERRDQLLATIQEVFPEITQEKRQSLFLADLLKTPLLLSKTPQEFVKMLDILLQRTSELRSQLTPHLPPTESQTARRGMTPDNLSGVWIDIMTTVLKEALPSQLSSLSTNRRYRTTPGPIDSQASTPEGNSLDHLLITVGNIDSIDGRAVSSRDSSANLKNRKRSDGSIGSAYTHLIPVDPSAKTPPIDHVFLPGDGTAATHVIVFHKADIIPHRNVLLETFPREMRIEEPLSLGMNRGKVSAPMLMAETGLLIPDLIRLEGEPPNLTEGTPTPIIEVLNLSEGVPEAFRMETYEARHEETRIARLFPTITSAKIRRIIRRAFYRAHDKLLGTVETAPVSRVDLKSFLYSESPPPADKTIGSLSITPEWMRIHDQSLHFLHKGNHRSLLRGLTYELACQNDPYFNPNESHTSEILYTGTTITTGDFLDFYRIQTRLGAFILVYNLEGKVLMQMHYTRPDSSSSPILSTHSSIGHEFAASQTTDIPGPRGFGVSGDTIVDSEESRETLPGPRKSLDKKGGEKII